MNKQKHPLLLILFQIIKIEKKIMTLEFWYTALALFVIRIVWKAIYVDPVMKRYKEAIGKADKEIELKEGSREAAELLSIIDKAEMERHPEDTSRRFEGSEFKYYLKQHKSGGSVLGMLITMAHELGCEMVLRRISEEDIESKELSKREFEEKFEKINRPFWDRWAMEYRKTLERRNYDR